MNFSLHVRQATRQLKQNDMSFTDVLTIVATQRHMTVNKSPVVIAEKKMFEKFEHKKKNTKTDMKLINFPWTIWREFRITFNIPGDGDYSLPIHSKQKQTPAIIIQ